MIFCCIEPIANFQNQGNFLFELIKWLTPVLLFILAYIINELIKQTKRKKNLSKLKDFFFVNLKAITKQSEAQIKQNIDCIKRLKNNQETDIKIRKISGNHLKRLNEIKFDDLFEIFILRRKGKSKKDENFKLFYDLNNNIDFIETSTPTLFESNIEAISHITLIGNQWNTTLKQISNFRNIVALEYNRNLPNSNVDPFADGFITLYDDFNKLDKVTVNNFYNVQHQLIIPLINHSQQFPPDSRAQFLIQLCSSVNILFDTIIHARYQNRKFLTLTTRALMKTNIQLKNFIKEYGE